MNISAIIVNYGTAHLLPPLIDNLKEHRQISQIIVVDNSQELTWTPLPPPFDDAKIIVNPENRGFGAAVNQGMEHAAGDWLLLINPDVRLEKGCIDSLANAAEQYRSPIVGPRFYWDEEHRFRLPPATGYSLWWSMAGGAATVFPLDAQTLSFYWTIRHERFWKTEKPFFEPFLSGACLLVNRDWLDAGEAFFDERFFLYFEDTDICARALAKGISPLCVPGAEAIHYYDQAPHPDQSKPQLMEASRIRFLEKYYGNRVLPEISGHAVSLPAADLGTLTTPPAFETKRAVFPEERYLEIGVNPILVPLVQADFAEDLFQFPQSVWSRLSPGRYFARIRGAVSGVEKVMIWKKP